MSHIALIFTIKVAIWIVNAMDKSTTKDMKMNRVSTMPLMHPIMEMNSWYIDKPMISNGPITRGSSQGPQWLTKKLVIRTVDMTRVTSPVIASKIEVIKVQILNVRSLVSMFNSICL